MEKAEREGRFGVVAIVSAQEYQWVFSGRNRSESPVANYEFTKAERRVGTYYFYVHDPDFGAGFIKIATYFPYPAKIWLNGHEWAKRQADKRGIVYTPLANGFASCEDPRALQRICDRFGPVHVRAFFERWMAVVPRPFTDADRRAGYFWDLSVRQLEASRTVVFDDPRRARGSSRPWSRTTWASDGPRRWPWCSVEGSSATPRPLRHPASSTPEPRSTWTFATSTPG